MAIIGESFLVFWYFPYDAVTNHCYCKYNRNNSNKRALGAASSDDGSAATGDVVVIPRATPRISSYFTPQVKKIKGVPPPDQMRLCGNAIDPSAAGRVSVAIADFLHSHCLPFSLATDPKLMKLLEEARSLGGGYTPPNRNQISGPLLDRLYEANWKDQMKTILSEARTFGVAVFGDGATIKTVPLVTCECFGGRCQ